MNTSIHQHHTHTLFGGLTMKRSFVFVVLVVTSAVMLTAQEKARTTRETTVSGTVVCVEEFLRYGTNGGDHNACAKAGGSLGIVTKDGQLFLSLLPDDYKLDPNAILMKYIGNEIEARGWIRIKAGVNGFVIMNVTSGTAGTQR